MTTILVVDDEPSIRVVVGTALQTRNYSVQLAEDGRSALDMVTRELPDLIVLDWMLPGVSGLEVCQSLRANPASAHVPIIFLTAEHSVDRKVASIESGADDYITKPFEARELLARVALQLRKAAERGEVNPLTLLPGNGLIEKEIVRRLEAPGRLFALIYFDLDEFKAYNDHFGFSWGDRLIKVLSESIQQAMILYGGDDKFIGHIGGDDFIAVASPDNAEAVCRHTVREFDRRARLLCAEAGEPCGFAAVDRAGSRRVFGPPTLSIGVVSNQYRSFTTFLDLGQVAAQVKKAAKSLSGSGYFIDRRQDYAS